MTPRPLRVALLGAGTVGLEVARRLLDGTGGLWTPAARTLVLAGVAVRDKAGAAARGLPIGLLTSEPAALAASDVDVVVELLGGEEPANSIISAALAEGKAVVSANKLVLAHHGAELEETARRHGAPLRFEAAVGGGTPILGLLANELAASRITRVRGIVNGTTNVILSAMAESGQEYEAALAAAQGAGYAEADPRADVEGLDAINKIVILARLAFGEWGDPANVATGIPGDPGTPAAPGITGVTAADITAAGQLDLSVKLVAAAERRPDGRLLASVLPSVVQADSPLGRTSGVRNRIEIDAWPIGQIAVSGPGAGGPATAAAVLADLAAIARGSGSTWAGLPPARPGGLAGPGLVAIGLVGPSGTRYAEVAP